MGDASVVDATADVGLAGDAAAPDASVSLDSESAVDGGASDAGGAEFKPLCGGDKDLVFANGFGTAAKDHGARVVVTNDGGIAVIATTGDFSDPKHGVLLRLNGAGNKVWQRTYGPGKDNSLHALAELADGGFVLAGQMVEESGNYGDMWMIRTDKDGKVGGAGTWEYKEGYPKYTDIAFGVTVGHEGALVMVGQTRSTNTDQIDGRMFGVTPQGKPLWDLIASGSNTDILYDVVKTPKGYAAAGESYGTGKGMWLVAADKKGKELWQNHYGKTSSDRAHAITTWSGGTVIAGRATTYACMWVVAVDENGAEQWKYELCDNQTEEAYDIAAIGAGGKDGFAVFGRSSTGGTDALLVRLSPFGGELFRQRMQKYHGGGDARGYGIATMPDGGFVMVGDVYKQPGNQGYADILVMRSDRWGHAGCKFDSKCANMATDQCGGDQLCTASLCDGIDGCFTKKLPDDVQCGPGKICKDGACK